MHRLTRPAREPRHRRDTDTGGAGIARLVVLLALAQSAAAGLDPSELPTAGINLANVNYWNDHIAFNDLIKQSNPWKKNNRYIAGDRLDPQGWPLGGESDIQITVFTDGAHFPKGDYVMTWKGSAQFRVEGVTEKSFDETAGRAVYSYTTDDAIRIKCGSVDAQDPIRDIHFYVPGGEHSQSRFYQPFLDNLAPFSTIRFMDWGETNHSDEQHWGERKQPDFYNFSNVTAKAGQSLGAAPYEVMIELCNELDAYPWICVPHKADEEYVRNLARLIKARLAPGQRCFVEYSNEVWNWPFSQSSWVANNSLVSHYGDSHPEKYAFFAERVFRCFREELADEPWRVIMVAAWQRWPAKLARVLAELERLGQPADVAAVTHYFTKGEDGVRMAKWIGPNWPTTADEVFARLSRGIETYDFTQWSELADTCTAFGVPLVSYEGGSHNNPGDNKDNADIVEFLRDLHRDPRMGELTRKALDTFKAAGGFMPMTFSDVGNWGTFGFWGHKEYTDQPIEQAHRMRAVYEWIEANAVEPPPAAVAQGSARNGAVRRVRGPGVRHRAYSLTGALLGSADVRYSRRYAPQMLVVPDNAHATIRIHRSTSQQQR